MKKILAKAIKSGKKSPHRRSPQRGRPSPHASLSPRRSPSFPCETHLLKPALATEALSKPVMAMVKALAVMAAMVVIAAVTHCIKAAVPHRIKVAVPHRNQAVVPHRIKAAVPHRTKAAITTYSYDHLVESREIGSG